MQRGTVLGHRWIHDYGRQRGGERLEPVDVKAIRDILKASQTEFALMIGVSVATLRNLEQGRRTPDGTARALLRVAARNPRAIAEALHRELRKGVTG